MKKLILAAVLMVVVIGVGMRLALAKDQDGPFGRSVRRLLCVFGIHKRLRRTVRKVSDGYTAHCRGCGILLYRATRDDPWAPADEAEEGGGHHDELDAPTVEDGPPEKG
jgi:hypothetical protein